MTSPAGARTISLGLVLGLFAMACASENARAPTDGGDAGNGAGGGAMGGAPGAGGVGTGGAGATDAGATGAGGAGVGGVGAGGSGVGGTIDAGTDATTVIAALCPGSPMRGPDSPAMTAAEFCGLYFQTCVGDAGVPDGGYATAAQCQTVYVGLQYQTTRQCRSYHVCNAAAYAAPSAVSLHCSHAAGVGPCVDTPIPTGG